MDLKTLCDFLNANNRASPASLVDGCIRIELPTGIVEIFHDPRGREFYGHWLGPEDQRVELIEIARQCGVQTQFMYHDEKSAAAVCEQLLAALAAWQLKKLSDSKSD